MADPTVWLVCICTELVLLAMQAGHYFGRRARIRDLAATMPDARSLALLMDWLTPEQRTQCKIHRWFEVVGGDTGARYRIFFPRPYNIIQRCECGGHLRLLCFVPKDQSLPIGDVLLMQKLALEKDETATLDIANVALGTTNPPTMWRHTLIAEFGQQAAGHLTPRGLLTEIDWA